MLSPAIRYGNRMTTQSQPSGPNIARRIFARVVGHKSVFAIRMVHEIAECQSLEFNDFVGQLRHIDSSLSWTVRWYTPLATMSPMRGLTPPSARILEDRHTMLAGDALVPLGCCRDFTKVFVNF